MRRAEGFFTTVSKQNNWCVWGREGESQPRTRATRAKQKKLRDPSKRHMLGAGAENGTVPLERLGRLYRCGDRESKWDGRGREDTGPFSVCVGVGW